MSSLRERPDDPDALDGVVSALREQADLLGGSIDDADVADAATIDGLVTRIVDRKLALQELDPRAVRRRSLAELAHVGLAPVPERVPTVLDAYAGRRRTAEDAVDRVRALMGVLHAVHGAKVLDVATSLKQRGLGPWLTPGERQFLTLLIQHPEREAEIQSHRISIARRVEGLHALGWALGLLPDLLPTGFSRVPPEVFAPVGPAAAAGAPTELALRDQGELLARLDVLTCAHRAVQEHEVGGSTGPLPRDVVPRAIAERRRALEWLLGTESWDEIEIDTDGRVRVVGSR
ncbi:DUF4272 domain-containing protein [Patulibacter sp. NPDC049589]|uniref:DUF4272 domain-containing protein n=1 Tax=Patulibacter sp. NPDC049589 TaxID=3154731 RepID=UPI003438A6C0